MPPTETSNKSETPVVELTAEEQAAREAAREAVRRAREEEQRARTFVQRRLAAARARQQGGNSPS